MKKTSLLLAVLLAVTTMASAGQLTVNDGTSYSRYSPFYVYFGDYATKVNSIYPAADLTAMNGNYIQSMTFYIHPSYQGSSHSTWELYLKEVDYTEVPTTPFIVYSATKVFTGMIDASTETLEIVFTEPFLYHGGNLMMATQNISNVEFANVQFWGTDIQGYNRTGYGRNSNSLYAITSLSLDDFLPKTTFEYATSANSCRSPKRLAADPNSVTITSATLSWQSNASNFVVAYGTGDDPDQMDTIHAHTTSATLTQLDHGTTYHVFVKAVCSATEESDWSQMATFTTLTACEAPTSLKAVHSDTTNTTLTWTSEAGNYTLQYKEATEEEWTTIDNITTNTYEIGALSPAHYQCRVRANCSNGYSSHWSAQGSFTTGIDCGEHFMSKDGIIGTASFTFYYFANAEASNTLGISGHIFTADEISALNLYEDNYLHGIKVHFATAGSMDLTVFVGTTDLTEFNASNANANTDGMTQVFENTLSFSAGEWAPIYFDTPFYYDGTRNLIIVVRRNSILHDDINAYFTNYTGKRPTYYGYKPPYSSNFIVYPNSFRPNIDFLFCAEMPACLNVSNITPSQITSHSATISWEPDNPSQEHFIVAYGTGDDPDQMTTRNIDTTCVTLSELSPQTTYHIFIKSICAANNLSDWSNACTFTTKCEASTIPYYEDFENRPMYSFLPCWDNSMSTTSSLNSATPNVWGTWGISINYVSNTMIRMYNRLVQPGIAAINMPDLELPANGDSQLRFDYSHRANCGNLIVKISADGGESYTTLAEYGATGTPDESYPDAFSLAVVDLSAYAGNTVSIQFSSVANHDRGAIFIDNVVVRPSSSCLEPLSVAHSNVTHTTADLSWTKGAASQDHFIVAYGTGTDPDEMATVESYTNSACLDNLVSGTTYNVFVKALCSATDESDWSRMHSFTTPCDAIIVDRSHPIIQDFENGMGCWEGGYTLGNTHTSYGIVDSDNHTPNGSYAYQMNSSHEAGDETQWLVSPEISCATGLEMDFWYEFFSILFDNEHLYVGYSTTTSDLSSMTNWTECDKLKTWTKKRLHFPVNTKFIAFKYTGNNCIDVSLDDINIHEEPTCHPPIDVTPSYVGIDNATITWTSSDSYFVVAYGTGDDPDEMATVETHTTSVSLTELIMGTEYNVFVKTLCSSDDESDWSEMMTFQTDCGSEYTITTNTPLIEEFETGGSTCWLRTYTLYNEGISETGNYGTYSGIKDIDNHTSGGSHCYMMESYSTLGTEMQDLYTPEIRTTASALEVSFWYKYGAFERSERFDIFYSLYYKDNIHNDISTYHYELPKTNVWEKAIKYIPINDPNMYVNIDFMYLGDNDFYVYLDDINIRVAPSCWTPDRPVVRNITTQSADISWAKTNIHQNNFIVAYGTGDNPDEMAIVEAHTTSVSLTDLMPGTDYNVFVKAVCSATDESDWSEMRSFMTLCEATVVDESNPIIQDFEGDMGCWTCGYIDSIGCNAYLYGIQSEYNHTLEGSHSFMMNSRYSYLPNGMNEYVVETQWLVSPAISSNSPLEMNFWCYFTQISNSEHLYVGYSTTTPDLNSISSWTECPKTHGWATHMMYFPANTKYIVFKYVGIDDGFICIDDIDIHAEPNRFATDGNWNVASNWTRNALPTSNDDATIAAAATIPSGCVASAKTIRINGGSITLEDGGQLVHDNDGVVVTVKKEIEGYEADRDNFYFVAPPISLNAENAGMLNNDYDLYRFEQRYDDLEWQNYEASRFNLRPDFGYLYANSDDVTLSFTGAMSGSGSPKGILASRYEGHHLSGFNLIGNPLLCNAAVTSDNANTLFYQINPAVDGEVIAVNNPIVAPTTGLFAVVPADSTNIYFERSLATANVGRGPSLVSIELMKGDAIIDRAYLAPTDCTPVEKLALSSNSSILYFEAAGEKLAKTSVDESGSATLVLETRTTGHYSLRVSLDPMSCSHLRLIDKLTGADIDLLKSPTYEFDATPDNLSARFVVVMK